MRTIMLFAYLAFSVIACQKKALKDDCDNLRQAVVNDDAALAKSAVDKIIGALPSSDYSQANLQRLADRLTTDCHLSTQLLCYSCIKTSPPQSELRISAGTGKERVLDISYNIMNRMTCLNMHH